MMGFGMMGAFGWISLIFGIAIIAGFAVVIIWAVKRFTDGSANPNQTLSLQSPREILQSRYARGEITRDQYQQMLQDLG